MKNVCRLAFRCAVVISVVLSVHAYAADKPPPAESMAKESLHQAEATIDAIDKSTRKITLRSSKGAMTMIAGPEVNNFDNIHVGDKVRVSYYEMMTAEIKKVGRVAQSGPIEAMSVYRAPRGSQPAAAAARATNAIVKIESVDAKAETITFNRSDGFTTTLDVKSPEGRKFIRTLRRGDEVEVTYMEALAVEVMPAQ